MFKKLLLAAFAAGLVSATTLPLQLAPAQAGEMVGMTCKDAGKAQYPDDRKARREFKKACKEIWTDIPQMNPNSNVKVALRALCDNDVTFKKNRARQRTRSARCPSAAALLVRRPALSRPGQTRIH